MSFVLALAAAAPFADLDAIDRQVAQFTGAAIGSPGGAQTAVDRRLRLQPCYAPLSLSWRGRETVVVQCPDGAGWKLYVPVSAGAGGPVALPAINRGDAVTIAVSGEGFTVSQPGEAMEGGPVGGWIKVRVVRADPRPAGAATADTMRAQVIRPGLVKVPLD